MSEKNKLVALSQWLGWGGLILLTVGSFAIWMLTRSGAITSATAGLAVVSIITGAVIGQVGRAQQGRVI